MDPLPRLAAAIDRHRRGLVAEAEAEYRLILAERPDMPEAHNALGIARQQQGDAFEAADAFRRALELKPDYLSAMGNLGAALLALDRREEAREILSAALAAAPDNPETHYNLAWAEQQDGRLEAAVELYDRTLALCPSHASALNNLGMSLRALGRLGQSLAAYERAVRLDAANPTIHYGRAQALLESGNFHEGWIEHEYRFASGTTQLRHPSLPRWQGELLAGRRILVWAEQGLGDSIQFCRYLPMLARTGARVVFEVQDPLARLLDGAFPAVQVLPRGGTLPACDFQVPLMSLPLHLEPEPFWPGPYLSADPAEAGRWRVLLGPKGHRRRIGVVWAGSPTHKDDGNRSMAPELLAPLAGLDGVDLVSLQVGPAAARPDFMSPLPETPADFAQSAGILAQMDLMISVDTSTLHLAGAMGLSAWAMLPFAPDWRWLHKGEASDWYPSLRLFRQPARKDWASVVDRIAAELASA